MPFEGSTRVQKPEIVSKVDLMGFGKSEVYG